MEQENLLTVCKNLLENADRDADIEYINRLCEEDYDDALNSDLMRAVKYSFTAFALLNDIAPDTLQGDTITRELFESMTENDYVSFHNFDLWLWSELS